MKSDLLLDQDENPTRGSLADRAANDAGRENVPGANRSAPQLLEEEGDQHQ